MIYTGINKTDHNVHCWLVIIFTWLTLIAPDRWKISNNYSTSHSHSLHCNKMDKVHAMCSHAYASACLNVSFMLIDVIVNYLNNLNCLLSMSEICVFCVLLYVGKRLGYLPISGMREVRRGVLARISLSCWVDKLVFPRHPNPFRHKIINSFLV